jgi:hypothetical protein
MIAAGKTAISKRSKPSGKRMIAGTAAADLASAASAIKKNPAFDAGSRPHSAGRLKSRLAISGGYFISAAWAHSQKINQHLSMIFMPTGYCVRQFDGLVAKAPGLIACFALTIRARLYCPHLLVNECDACGKIAALLYVDERCGIGCRSLSSVAREGP